MTKVIKDTQTVAPGNTVKLLSLNLTASSDLDITNYYVEFPATFPWTSFEDGEVTLYVDGIDYTIKKTDLSSNQYILSNKNDWFTVSDSAVNVYLE
jgi:hypothetical protein